MSSIFTSHYSSARLLVATVLVILFCAGAAFTIVGGTSGGADVIAIQQ